MPTFPVQNIPGLGNVQVIPATALGQINGLGQLQQIGQIASLHPQAQQTPQIIGLNNLI